MTAILLDECAGISLAYFKELANQYPTFSFNDLCVKIKEITMETKTSLIQKLHDDPFTSHHVKAVADVFISYAWKTPMHSTISAISRSEPAEVFIWMDIFCVNQHTAAMGTMSFEDWTHKFGDSLKRIGRAVVVLFPCLNPIAVKRSWCVFEQYLIVSSKIEHTTAVSEDDELAMISGIHHSFTDIDAFRFVFAAINVMKAEAFLETDRANITSMVEKVGPLLVNDLTALALKSSLREILNKAKLTAKTPQEEFNVLVTLAAFHYVVGEREAMIETSTMVWALVQEHNMTGANRARGLVLHAEEFKKSPEGMINAIKLLTEADRLYKDLGDVLHKVDVDYAMAEICVDLERYEDALKMVELGFKDFTAAEFDTNHRLIADLYNSRGLAYLGQKKYDLALTAFQQAVEIQTTVLGPDHSDLANTLNNIGIIFSENKQYGEALEMWTKSVEIKKRALGVDHHTVATSLQNIAMVHELCFQWAEALEYYTLAVQVKGAVKKTEREEAVKACALMTLFIEGEAVNKACLVLLEEKKYDEAVALVALAVKLQLAEPVTTNERRKVAADLLVTKAEAHYGQGKLDVAFNQRQEALTLQVFALGKEHVDCASSHKRLGDLMEEIGETEPAFNSYRSAVEIWTSKADAGTNLALANSLYSMAGIRYNQRTAASIDEACTYFEQAKAIFIAANGADDGIAQQILTYVNAIKSVQANRRKVKAESEAEDFNIACYDLMEEKKYDEVLALADKGIALVEQFGRMNEWIAQLLVTKSDAYFAKAEVETALSERQAALEMQLTVLGKNHVDCATSYKRIAAFLEQLGRLELAMDALKAAVEIWDNNPDSETSVPLAYALYSMGGILYKKYEYEDACPYFKRAGTIFTAVFGEDDARAQQALSYVDSIEPNEAEIAMVIASVKGKLGDKNAVRVVQVTDEPKGAQKKTKSKSQCVIS